MKKVMVSLIVGGLSVSSSFGMRPTDGLFEFREKNVSSANRVVQSEDHRSNNGSRVRKNNFSATMDNAATVGVVLAGGVAMGVLMYYNYKALGSLSGSLKTVVANNTESLIQGVDKVKSAVVENVNVDSTLKAAKAVGTKLSQSASVAKQGLSKSVPVVKQFLNKGASVAKQGLSKSGPAVKQVLGKGAHLFKDSVVGSAKFGWNSGSYVNGLMKSCFLNGPSSVAKGLWWEVSTVSRVVSSCIGKLEYIMVEPFKFIHRMTNKEAYIKYLKEVEYENHLNYLRALSNLN